MSVGIPRLLAASSVAALAYLLRKSRATPILAGDHSGRLKPLTGRPIILYPAAGTRCISILPNAPTKSISALGRFAFMAFAIETAGNMCPPVPPPLTMTLMSFSIFSSFFQITKLIIFSDKAQYCADYYCAIFMSYVYSPALSVLLALSVLVMVLIGLLSEASAFCGIGSTTSSCLRLAERLILRITPM